jgi:pimeloyl-ACP methyl ester carboxylesterase
MLRHNHVHRHSEKIGQRTTVVVLCFFLSSILIVHCFHSTNDQVQFITYSFKKMRNLLQLLMLTILSSISIQSYSPPTPPKVSPATNCENQLYSWRNQQIRYQQAGPASGQPVLLIHGLFVNSDHWRKTILGLSQEGFNVFALDLLGYGYSSKLPPDSQEGKEVNGEQGRPDVVKDVELGTANGKAIRVRDVDLKHPTGSPYNFFTWSELINDFCQQVVKQKDITLVANSIGSISVLQAIVDSPELYSGACLVTPNFRELHKAEVPFSGLAMPIIQTVQKTLREKGQGLFDALATPETVKKILKEPYKVTDAIDDTLVQVLLDPLLLPGGSNVVFDTLSYSAGPLPEQQLSGFPEDKPVWICYGKDDPWTPSARVDALMSKPCVERVVGWDGVGHCPHDEAPELVNPFVMEFLEKVKAKKKPTDNLFSSFFAGL